MDKEHIKDQTGFGLETFDIEDNKIIFHINMTGIPLPEGNCDDFVNYYRPVMDLFLQGKNSQEVEVVWNHPFECNMMLINGEWWFKTAWDFVRHYQLNPSNVTIITGNYRIFWNYQKWHRSHEQRNPLFNLEVYMQMLWCYAPNIFNQDRPEIEFKYCDVDNDRPLGYTFNTLNRVPRRNRMHLFEVLCDRDLLKYGLCSFNEVGHSDIIGGIPDNYLEQLPIFLDRPQDRSPDEWIYNTINVHQYYPEVTDHTNHYAPILENSLVSVVAETSYGLPETIPEHHDSSRWYPYFDEGFITEKTFRTIANGHPCIWVSAHGTTKVLQRLGFKTYSEFWDESYDSITDPLDRINAVADLIEQLSKLNHTERKELYNKMKPTLKHNQELIRNLTEIPKLTWKDYHEYLKYEI